MNATVPGPASRGLSRPAAPPRLISVGNVVVDLTVRVRTLPERGGDVIAHSTGLNPGGAAFNVLVAAARQGLSAAYGGAHGTGPFGNLARAAMRREGIAVLLPPVPDADTGYTVAITDDEGERTFITAVGAEAHLTAERIAAVLVTPTDVVHVSGYGLLHDPSGGAIADWLARLPQETVVLVDPGPLGHDIPAATLATVQGRATWWSCSLSEAFAATGAGDPAQAVQRLRAGSNAMGRPGSDMGVVVRLGADGCIILAPGGESEHVPGFTVNVVDSNGAGDAHVGAFLAALAAGQHPLDAARRANACAAIAVTRSGPATAPTRDEVDALFLAKY